jgi:hypothetical protein
LFSVFYSAKKRKNPDHSLFVGIPSILLFLFYVAFAKVGIFLQPTKFFAEKMIIQRSTYGRLACPGTSSTFLGPPQASPW